MQESCPQCCEKLTKETYGFFDAASCLYCDGAWLPGTSFSSALALSPGAPDLNTLLEKVSVCGQPRSNLVCPACGTNSFKSIEAKGIEIDLCPQCGGIYFDKGELEKLFPDVAQKIPPNPLGVVAIEVAGDIVSLILIALFSGGC